MEWPSDVLAHVWDLVRTDLRPRLKQRAWKHLHSELKMKWTTKVLRPLWSSVTYEYLDHIEEGNFEMGEEMASVDTIRALVCTWNLQDTWRIIAEANSEDDERSTNQWMDNPAYAEDSKKVMHDAEDFHGNGSVVENPAAMVDCMRRNGVEISVRALSISEMPTAI